MTQVQTEPQGTTRKRLLACIIYVVAAADRGNLRVIENLFEKCTGFTLAENEAKEAFIYLMDDKAPELRRILAGASDKERQVLLRTAVQTWSAHGMDSETATMVTERIVSHLGFDQDDICKTLDRLWMKEQANTGAKVTYKAARAVAKTTIRATVRGTQATARAIAPHARRLGTRAYSAIQR